MLLLAGIATTAALPATAQAVRWDQIWDQPDIAVIYVDRGSVTGTGDIRSIATRTVYAGELPDGYIAERVRTEEFDCRSHRSRIRFVRIVAKDGRPPKEFTWSPDESNWSDPEEPDTLGYAKLEAACGTAA